MNTNTTEAEKPFVPYLQEKIVLALWLLWKKLNRQNLKQAETTILDVSAKPMIKQKPIMMENGLCLNLLIHLYLKTLCSY